MAALTADRDTKQKAGPVRALNLPVAASTTIYAGSMVAENGSGYLVPASASNALIVVGIAQENVDNSAGSAGDENCEVKTQVVGRFANGDSIAVAQRGDLCYAGDDQTVHQANIDGDKPVAGLIMDVDSTGTRPHTP